MKGYEVRYIEWSGPTAGLMTCGGTFLSKKKAEARCESLNRAAAKETGDTRPRATVREVTVK
jgi:hypothetical protein